MKDKETRQYIIPLRREFLKTPKWRRTEKAVSTIKSFLKKHTKADKIKIGEWLNQELWSKGSKNPPSKVKIAVNTNKEKIIINKKKNIEKDILVASAELAVLPAKAKRLEEKEKKVREAVKKLADKKKGMLEKAKEGLKTDKASEDKKSEPEDKISSKKEPAKISKKQETSMHKK